MGQLYRIFCKACGSSAGVSEGVGMRCRNTFEDLFMNYMSKDDRVRFAVSLPELHTNSIKRCTYTETPLRCPKCLTLTSTVTWSVELREGWNCKSSSKCGSCSAELETFTFPGEGEFRCQCWACGSDTLNVELEALWD